MRLRLATTQVFSFDVRLTSPKLHANEFREGSSNADHPIPEVRESLMAIKGSLALFLGKWSDVKNERD